MGHHYVPQEYLRGFAAASSPKALWQYDKDVKSFSSKPASIKKIAQRRQFYDDATEADLNQLVEIPGNQVLRKLRGGDLLLSDQEKLNLSVYIATMMKRVPHSRVRGEAIAPKALAKVADRLRARIRDEVATGLVSPERAALALDETDRVETMFSEDVPAEVRKQIESPWPTERIVDAVYGMHWRFAQETDGQFFITTDNPAFFFSGRGLGRSNSELTFPVSRTLAIFGSWSPTRRKNLVIRSSQFVKEANRRLISDATRFVYSQFNRDWIAKVSSKKAPYLSEIRW